MNSIIIIIIIIIHIIIIIIINNRRFSGTVSVVIRIATGLSMYTVVLINNAHGVASSKKWG